MRQDINVSVETGNLRLVDVSAIPIVEFEWNNVDNDYVVEDNYLIANITLPSYYQLTDLQNVGVRISIPTTPLYLPIKFRFLRRTNSSLETAVFNSQPNIYNNDLFSVVDENGSEIKASELWMLHDSTYLIRLNDNDVSIFSGSTSDFEVSNANFQNRDFLIKCVPSNHYRYPSSGVGLIRYLHSNIDDTDFVRVLKREFEADDVIVREVEYEGETFQLILDLDFSKADASTQS